MAHGGQVLRTIGIDLRKCLVPFRLEVDAGVRQVTAKDGQQIVLHFTGAQFVQSQGSGQHTLEDLGMAGVLQLEDREIRLLIQDSSARAVQCRRKFAGGVAEHQLADAGHVRLQLRLLNLAAISQPVVVQLELTLVGEIFVIVTDTLANTAQHNGSGGGQSHLQQDVGAVVRKIEAPAGIDVMGTEVHPAFVNDQQELQGIDQAGFTGIVGRDQ